MTVDDDTSPDFTSACRWSDEDWIFISVWTVPLCLHPAEYSLGQISFPAAQYETFLITNSKKKRKKEIQFEGT